MSEQDKKDHLHLMTNGGLNKIEDASEPAAQRPLGVVSAEAALVMTNQYEVLRHMMVYFSIRDLMTAWKVCRDWLIAAEHEKAYRTLVGGMYWTGYVPNAPSAAFDKWAGGLQHPTLLCLWFSSEKPSRMRMDNASGPYLEEKVKELLAVLEAPLLTVISEMGVIGTSTDCQVIREGPMWNNTTFPYASLLMLPKMQGVEVHHFQIKMSVAKQVMRINHIEKPTWMAKKINGPNKPIRCILFFILETLPIEPGVIFRALQKRQSQKLVMGGSVLMENSTLNAATYGIVGVVFYGRNIEASSLALTLAHKTPEAVESRMKAFARGALKGKFNVGLMFSCCGRGLSKGRNSQRTMIDSKAFKRHFPGTSLHGVIGLGEIGCDWLPVENGVLQSKLTDSEWIRMFVQQEYATVIVHLAIGLESYESELVSAHQMATEAVAAALRRIEPDAEDDADADAGGGDAAAAGPSARPTRRSPVNRKRSNDTALEVCPAGPSSSGDACCPGEACRLRDGEAPPADEARTSDEACASSEGGASGETASTEATSFPEDPSSAEDHVLDEAKLGKVEEKSGDD